MNDSGRMSSKKNPNDQNSNMRQELTIQSL